MATLRRVVAPRDCALLVALPLSREEFLRDLEETSPQDLAKSLQRSHPGLRDSALFSDVYRPLLELLLDVAGEAGRHGVTVCLGGRLSDLAELLTQVPIVTLITHWRFPQITEPDLVDVSELLARIRTAEEPLTRYLREELTRSAASLLGPSADQEPSCRTALAAELNRLLLENVAHYQSEQPAAQDLKSIPSVRVTRALLEEEFPSSLQPAGAIEFRDGLQTVASVVDAVPESFDGLLDLSVCNSIILAESIKRQRRGCMVIANRRPARLNFRLIRYRLLIRELARTPGPYVEALARLQTALLTRLS